MQKNAKNILMPWSKSNQFAAKINAVYQNSEEVGCDSQ